MQCTRPVKIRTPKGVSKVFLKSLGFTGTFLVPCGRCLSCKKNKSREWALRIQHELEFWDTASFITLTYDDEHLPKTKTLEKTELQNFFKRLRKNYILRIKYYAAGEYGDRNGRPHYHAIVFGISPENMKILLPEAWDKCDWTPWRLEKSIGFVSFASARYVAQYINKKYYGELAERIYKETGREPPFQLQSQGFGLEYCMRHSQQLSEDLFINHQGSRLSIPRYYLKHLNIDPKRLRQLRYERQIEMQRHYAEKFGTKTISDFLKQQEKVNKQREATVKTRFRINNENHKKI